METKFRVSSELSARDRLAVVYEEVRGYLLGYRCTRLTVTVRQGRMLGSDALVTDLY